MENVLREGPWIIRDQGDALEGRDPSLVYNKTNPIKHMFAGWATVRREPRDCRLN